MQKIRQELAPLRPVVFWLLVACTLGIGATGLLHPKSTTQENRLPAPLPALTVDSTFLQFPAAFDAYVADHFGMRTQLVQASNRAKLLLMQKSANPRVLVGKDGWLFLQSPELVADLRGEMPFSPAELLQWRLYLEKRSAWFAARGIQYHFVLVPNKHTIYPEFLPQSIGKRGQTRREQLLDYLQSSPISYIDFTNVLNAAKKEPELLYFRQDTHWTDTAAYAAYNRLVETLGLVPLSESAFSVEKRIAHLAVLIRFMALEGVLPKAHYAYKTLKKPTATVQPEDPVHEIQQATSPASGRLLVYRDSYMDPLVPLLSEHFGSSTYVRKSDVRNIAVEDIATYAPTVVIEEIVEGKLLSVPIPKNPEPM